MQWHRGRGRPRAGGLIRATEIASFVYCPEAWRLEYGLGLPAANRAARDDGTRHHARQAAAERVAGWSIRLGRVIVILALALLLLWVLAR
jgi:hypothetical protein